MRRGSFAALALTASLLALACNGPEIAVFELPALSMAGTGGAAGSPTVNGGSAGASGPNAGSSYGGAAAGNGDFPSQSGGAAGSSNTAGSSGGGDSGPTKCSVESDCMLGWQCEKQGCSDTEGVCVPWPPFCPSNPAPVCGCDGITYWNDCIRLQSGARLAAFDQCRASACTCEVGTDCTVPTGTYASCSHLLPSGAMCGHGIGACWVLPAQCDPSADKRLWRECKPPDPGEVPGCLDTCSAIASEHTYAELHRGDTCN